jgi:predicted RNase H-like nuclease (RuvC/YqgF family)
MFILNLFILKPTAGRTVAGKPVSSSIKDTSYRSNLEPAYSKVQEQNLTIASLQRRLCAVEHELSSIDELVSSVSHISLEHLSPDTDRIYTQSFDMKTGKGRSATPKPVFKKVEEVMGHFAEQLVQSTWNIKEQSESVIEIEEENVALKEENRKLEEENIWLEGKIEMLVKVCH